MLNEMQASLDDSVTLVEPGENPFSVTGNLNHEWDLFCFLLVVSLINTDGIRP